MADVFLARQLGPAGFQKECVIKRILPLLGQDPQSQSIIDMFLDEARIAARLSHPNIVHIFDLGQVDGDYFLALEYVDGITIESLLERAKQSGQSALPWPIAVRIVSNVAEGLEHAHKAKDSSGQPLMLVHRDISPSNIMVSWDGVARILDFGIAKAVSASGAKVKTGIGIIKGKVPYMSPEQIQGLDLDGRSDIFSLGVVLYEMTTGQRPFPGDTTGQLTVQIASREPRAPESINPAFPRDLAPLLMRALAKSVDKRYQSARDFKLDLEQFLADQLVSCTNYDVEAYLRELVRERPRIELPSPEEIARVEAEEVQGQNPALAPSAPTAASTALSTAADGRPSGAARPGSGEDKTGHERRGDQSSGPGIDVLEADNAAEQRRHRQSGGSGVLMGAITLLVIATAVIFYLLHERAVQTSNTAAAAPQATAPSLENAAPAPSPAPAPVGGAKPPQSPAAAPTAAPNVPQNSVEKTAENAGKTAKTEKIEEPKSADSTKKAESAENHEKSEDPESESKPKTKPRRARKHDEDEAPKEISKLPLPPPPPPEP